MIHLLFLSSKSFWIKGLKLLRSSLSFQSNFLEQIKVNILGDSENCWYIENIILISSFTSLQLCVQHYFLGLQNLQFVNLTTFYLKNTLELWTF